MARPTITEIKDAIKGEGSKHGLDQATVRIDLAPPVILPHLKIFCHEVTCRCGHKFEVSTMHSANTPEGATELNQCLITEVAEHALQSSAEMLYKLYEPVN